jgi:sugar lactone lactonase YvrE
MTRNGTAFRLAAATVAACLLAIAQPARAGLFTVTVFAQGTSVNATAPDSITTDAGGNIWIEYGNGASSTLPPGQGGSSTIVQYNPLGQVLNTYSVPGSADGLRYNSATNQMWVLQNQDDNSALTTINASTGVMAHYTYTTATAGRGYDDVAFVGGNAYLSYTNPVNSTDPIIVQATLGAGTVSVTPVLALNATGTNTATGQTQPILANDPDSLTLRPNGSLLLTSEADGALTTVQNPGAGQSVSFVKLVDPTGKSVTGLDDTVFASASNQRLLVSDTANNTVYAVQGPFQVGAAYGSLASTNSVDLIDTTTGISTSITDGLLLANASPHGLAFVAAIPEPSTLATSVITMLAGLGYTQLRRKRTVV